MHTHTHIYTDTYTTYIYTPLPTPMHTDTSCASNNFCFLCRSCRTCHPGCLLATNGYDHCVAPKAPRHHTPDDTVVVHGRKLRVV